MTAGLSWLLLLVVLTGVMFSVSLVWRQRYIDDETPADPTGWRALEEEANRFRIIRPPYDQDQEDQI